MRTRNARSKTAIAAVLLPALSGCGSIGLSYGTEAAYNAAFRDKIIDASTLSADALSQVQKVKFVASAQAIEGSPRGEVVGLSCKLTVAVFVFKWVWTPELNEANGLTPEDAAQTQLRIKAMQIGANAVVAPACTHKDGIDWGNNCFDSWRCAGQAYVVP